MARADANTPDAEHTYTKSSAGILLLDAMFLITQSSMPVQDGQVVFRLHGHPAQTSSRSLIRTGSAAGSPKSFSVLRLTSFAVKRGPSGEGAVPVQYPGGSVRHMNAMMLSNGSPGRGTPCLRCSSFAITQICGLEVEDIASPSSS